jgi:uncharacterized protein (DUF1800 family)
MPDLVEPLQRSASRDADAAAAPVSIAATAALLLSACGGGAGDGLPEAFFSGATGGTRRDILAVSAATDTPPGIPTPTPAELMDWAEAAYPQYFPGHQPELAEAPYVYRHYAETGNYVGVAGSTVYLFGPVAGNPAAPVVAGQLTDFAAQVRALKFPATDAEAARFLAQATLAPTDADIADVRALGYDAWLTREFAKPVSSSNWSWLTSQGIDQDPLNRNGTKGADPQIWQRLISAPDSLRQRVALAWSEIFVVGLDGVPGPWKQFKMAYWWDLLANGALGSYRSLLEAITLSPAMGGYLNMAGNQKENTATGRLPDENYAREVMQLFSIGLLRLNPDGSAQRDASGKPLETYTQDTVTQLARVLTGWNLDSSPFVAQVETARRPMVLNAALHSTLAASFLGTTVPANTDGTTALRMALDTLAAHPNVGPFLGRQLIQRLVTSNPSPAYIARVSARFADNGAGVRGDLSAVVRAVLTDVEARGPAALSDPEAGKLREPILRFVQWARVFKAVSISGAWAVGDMSDAATRLGQSPLRSPTVFNFFRPGYVPAGTSIATAGLTVPELQLANESTVAGYLNFMQLAIPGGRFDLKPDYSAELALATDATALVARIERLMCANQLLATSRATIVSAVNSIAAGTDAGKANRVYTAVMLMMACPEYLVQK